MNEPVPDSARLHIPFTTGDLDRLEAINLLLCDGYAGTAAVQLGAFLDELQQREFTDG